MLTQHHADTPNLFYADKLSQNNAEKRSRKWQCKLPETVIGDFLIIPLTSAKMLKSETYWMSNCCKDYLFQCAGLEYSVFSIRTRTGERLATLGLRNDNGYWQFDQCYGPSNSEVLEESHLYLDEEGTLQSDSFPTELYYVAHEVVRLMNAGQQRHVA